MIESVSLLDYFDRAVQDSGTLHTKLTLLVGPPKSGKSSLLRELSLRRSGKVISVGATLGRLLLAVPIAQRPLRAAVLLRELIQTTSESIVLLDNIELLFDRTLQLNPLDLLRRQAQLFPVVAAWPGEIRHNRLAYAPVGHPEHRDFAIGGLVSIELK